MVTDLRRVTINEPGLGPNLDRPVFVVGVPRTGVALFYDVISTLPGVYAADETGDPCDRIAGLHPQDRGWASSRLTSADAIPTRVDALRAALSNSARDAEDRRPASGVPVRMVHGSPLHVMRIPFLASAFPDALFVITWRSVQSTLASTAEAWTSGRFATYDLPDWRPAENGTRWSYSLTPDWRELANRPLETIVERQWESSVRTLVQDLGQLDRDRWIGVELEELVDAPAVTLNRIVRFIDVAPPSAMPEAFLATTSTVTPPHPDKWRASPWVPAATQRLTSLANQAESWILQRPAAARSGSPTPDRPTTEPGGAFDAQATRSAVEVMVGERISLAVSTYHANRLVLLRAAEGRLDMVARAMARPMGLWAEPGRLWVGTRTEVLAYANHPSVASARRSVGHGADSGLTACYLPLSRHTTGDVKVHDVAWLPGLGVVGVSSAFSCLFRLHPDFSFVPVWHPPFISGLAGEDRCHLNGMAVTDDRVTHVTAFAESDVAHGWRDSKGTSGIVIDVASNEVVCRGLAMPHSPRWHDGALWLLESGTGTLARLDPDSGRVETVAQVPGFARGLTFAGPYACIGVSMARDRVFRGLPATRLGQQRCGIWFVDLRTGRAAGHIEFVGSLHEIYDVLALEANPWPDLDHGHGADAEQAFLVPSGPLSWT